MGTETSLTPNLVGPLAWTIFDAMLRAFSMGWAAGPEPWGVRIEPHNTGVAVHLRATLDGIKVTLDPRRGEWDLIVGLRWDPTTRSIVGYDGRDGIDVVAEHVLQMAA